MLAELRERDEPVVPAVAAIPAEALEIPERKIKLPPLDDLVANLPAETRQLLDELFRARFTAVRRVLAKALKP